jgi:hypothetical protein
MHFGSLKVYRRDGPDPRTALVIGNGRSRADLDLYSIDRDKVTTFGCNALYRDYAPDYLLANDRKMVAELIGADYPAHNRLVTSDAVEITMGTKTFRFSWLRDLYGENVTSTRWVGFCGTCAIRSAAERGHSPVYLIGFDFSMGQNVYQGTINYHRRMPATTHEANQLSICEGFPDEFENTRFVQLDCWHEARGYEQSTWKRFSAEFGRRE